MENEDKLYFQRKYGHSKILLFIHLMGKYIKDLYHPVKSKKPQVFGKGNIIPFVPKGVQIEIYGDNNKVEIDPSVTKWDGHIGLGDIFFVVNPNFCNVSFSCSMGTESIQSSCKLNSFTKSGCAQRFCRLDKIF